MNIFVVDINPIIAAQSLCDCHVVKMIIESAQLLSTQDRLKGHVEFRYQSTHVNHPCRKCLDEYSNYVWLCNHLSGLLKEYTHRYNRIHAVDSMYALCDWNIYSDTSIEFYSVNCSLPKCMPDEYKVGSNSIEDTVQSYKNYYKFKQDTLTRFRYTNRSIPEWLKG